LFLLILESLGSTELVFILVMALVFFGPRKLPQLSRSMGKHLAEFRRASEDFKRTWDREVTLEDAGTQNSASSTPHQESTLWDENREPLGPPAIEAVAADRVIPRQPVDMAVLPSSDETDLSSVTASNAAIDPPEPSRKRDWL
jgi:TatA/E family protein of Tat protein translocase